MDTHKFEVHEISNKVKLFYEARRPFSVYHGTTNSNHSIGDPRAVVNTSGLRNILDVNVKSRFAMVEPNVPMDSLVKETLRFGLVPPVVPAFPGITVGGTFSGTSASSSSFKYGFFDRIITWIEVVLPDGGITKASKKYNPELLSGMVGALGTVGIVTLFQIRLVPAKQYVNVKYIPVRSTMEALDTLDAAVRGRDNDFVEGFIYGKHAPSFGVVCVGRWSSTQDHPKQQFSRARDPWFYIHALKTEPATESVPVTDYVFRYDRGSFCMGRYCFGRLPFNKFTKYITDSAMHSRKLAKTVQSLNWSQHFFIQDLVIPVETVATMLGYLERHLGIYPLRLCPIQQSAPAIMRPNPRQSGLFIGVGIRGYTAETINNTERFNEKNRNIERLVRELGGVKWLYSRNFCTPEEFWSVYPKAEYDALRASCNAQYLLDVYEKIHKVEECNSSHRPRGFWNRIFAYTSVLAQSRASKGSEKP